MQSLFQIYQILIKNFPMCIKSLCKILLFKTKKEHLEFVNSIWLSYDLEMTWNGISWTRSCSSATLKHTILYNINIPLICAGIIKLALSLPVSTKYENYLLVFSFQFTNFKETINCKSEICSYTLNLTVFDFSV